jgi:hypothetical protein
MCFYVGNLRFELIFYWDKTIPSVYVRGSWPIEGSNTQSSFLHLFYLIFGENYLYGPVKLTYSLYGLEKFKIPCMILCLNLFPYMTLPLALQANDQNTFILVTKKEKNTFILENAPIPYVTLYTCPFYDIVYFYALFGH